MTVTLPRLDRKAATTIVETLRHEPLDRVASLMPVREAVVTYPALAGNRMTPADPRFVTLRQQVVALARSHGMPGPLTRRGEFEGRCARLIRDLLPLTPYEASSEEAWSYVTCCCLLDVAFWRWDRSESIDRYVGHVNRNTFRRMWWRADVLGPDIDLTRLGEDEFTAIMERPTIAADQRLARTIATAIITRVDAGAAAERMNLVRDAMKRILRLTPVTAFESMDDVALAQVVREVFDQAEASLAGRPLPERVRNVLAAPAPSPGVEHVGPGAADDNEPPVGVPVPRSRALRDEFEIVSEAALDIARRTGRVTNSMLREAALITSDEAREVLQSLVARGALERRGEKRGTHYVVVSATPRVVPPSVEPTSTVAASEEVVSPATGWPVPVRRESALRRLLRRDR